MTKPSTPSSLRSGKPAKTQGFEVIAWIEKYCVFTQAEWFGKPFRLLSWQKRLILGLFALDPETRRRMYRWAYISVPKKQGKTELMAALGLYFLIGSGEPSPLVVCAAGSDDQADLIFGAAKIMAEQSPTLKAVCQTFEDEILVPEIPGAKLVRVAASARRYGSNLDGKNVYVVICDELHVWEGERGEIVWGTLTRGTGARREPMVIQITTAGYDRDSICWRQYEMAKQVLADPSANPHYFAFISEAPEGADHTNPEVWAAANPSFGVTVQPEFYSDQLRVQPANEFKRFYLNVWTKSQESWLPPGAWEACKDEDAEIPDGSEVYGGVDVALYHDSTAVVITSQVDGKWVVKSRVWRWPKGDKLDVAEVMQHIRDLSKSYKLQEVSYDPRFFDVPAGSLMDEGIPMVEIPQSPEMMVPACGLTYELIVNQQVVHDGDPVLEDHVLSAAQRAGERGWTLSKGKSKRKIDACIAMVLALHRAHGRNADPGVVNLW